MSIKSTLNALRNHPALAALFAALFFLVLGASEWTSTQEKEALRSVRSAEKAVKTSKSKLDKLHATIEKTLDRERNAEADVEFAKSLLAGDKSKKTGLFSRSPEARLKKAVAAHAAAIKDVGQLKTELGHAERNYQLAKNQLTEANRTLTAAKRARGPAPDGSVAKRHKKVTQDHERASSLAQNALAKVEEIQRGLESLKASERAAFADVDTKTRIAAQAGDKASRRAANSAMYDAERKGAKIAKQIKSQRQKLLAAKESLDAANARIAVATAALNKMAPEWTKDQRQQRGAGVKVVDANADKKRLRAERNAARADALNRKRAKAEAKKRDRASRKVAAAKAKLEAEKAEKQATVKSNKNEKREQAKRAEKLRQAQAKRAERIRQAEAKRTAQERRAAEKLAKRASRAEADKEKREMRAKEAAAEKIAEQKRRADRDAAKKVRREMQRRERQAATAEKAKIAEQKRLENARIAKVKAEVAAKRKLEAAARKQKDAEERAARELEELKYSTLLAAKRAGEEKKKDLEKSVQLASRAQSASGDKVKRAKVGMRSLDDTVNQLQAAEKKLTSGLSAKSRAAASAKTDKDRRAANKALQEAEENAISLIKDLAAARGKLSQETAAVITAEKEFSTANARHADAKAKLNQFNAAFKDQVSDLSNKLKTASKGEVESILADLVGQEKDIKKIAKAATAEAERALEARAANEQKLAKRKAKAKRDMEEASVRAAAKARKQAEHYARTKAAEEQRQVREAQKNARREEMRLARVAKRAEAERQRQVAAKLKQEKDENRLKAEQEAKSREAAQRKAVAERKRTQMEVAKREEAQRKQVELARREAQRAEAEKKRILKRAEKEARKAIKRTEEERMRAERAAATAESERLKALEDKAQRQTTQISRLKTPDESKSPEVDRRKTARELKRKKAAERRAAKKLAAEERRAEAEAKRAAAKARKLAEKDRRDAERALAAAAKPDAKSDARSDEAAERSREADERKQAQAAARAAKRKAKQIEADNRQAAREAQLAQRKAKREAAAQVAAAQAAAKDAQRQVDQQIRKFKAAYAKAQDRYDSARSKVTKDEQQKEAYVSDMKELASTEAKAKAELANAIKTVASATDARAKKTAERAKKLAEKQVKRAGAKLAAKRTELDRATKVGAENKDMMKVAAAELKRAEADYLAATDRAGTTVAATPKAAEKAPRKTEVAAVVPNKADLHASTKEQKKRDAEIKKLRGIYEKSGTAYSKAQTEAAEAAQRIETSENEIKELEATVQQEKMALAEAMKAVGAAETRKEKKSTRKVQRNVDKRVRHYNKALKSTRAELARSVERAAAAQKRLDAASEAFKVAEAAYSPYVEEVRAQEEAVATAKFEAEKMKREAKDTARQAKIAKALEKRKQREAAQLARAKQNTARQIAKTKDGELREQREAEEKERKERQDTEKEQAKEERKLEKEKAKIAKKEGKEQAKEEIAAQKTELEARRKADQLAEQEEKAQVKAQIERLLAETEGVDKEKFARKGAEKDLRASAAERKHDEKRYTDDDRRRAEAADVALRKYYEKKEREQEIAKQMIEREKKAAELALKKVLTKRSTSGELPPGLDLPASTRYDEETLHKSRLDLKGADDQLEQAQIELYDLENNIAPLRKKIKELEGKEQDVKQYYVEMIKRSGIVSGGDWNRAMEEIKTAEKEVNKVMDELKDALFEEAKMNVQIAQAQKNVEDARSGRALAQKRVADLNTAKAYLERQRLERISQDTYQEQGLTERDMIEIQMERKGKTELEQAEREFESAQNAVHDAEQKLENLRVTLNGLISKEQEAKEAYALASQEALTTKGRQDWDNALKSVRDAEGFALEVSDIVSNYRQDKNEAEIELIQSNKDLDMARARLKVAQKSWQLYQQASVERRERDRLRDVELEMATARTEREVEKADPGIAGKDGVSYQGVWPPDASGGDVNARAMRPDGKKYDINAVVVTGDREAVQDLENWRDYENDALYTPMSEADIESFRQRILKDLQDSGYVFSTVSVYKHSLNLGFLKFRVHVGEKGEVTVVGNRWYTARQILTSAAWETGEQFNYRRLYSDLFDFNTKPDVRINTKLLPRVDEFGNRIVDVEMNIEDRFPIHGSMKLSNDGKFDSGGWRARTTLQHLNLSRRSDILSVEWTTAPKAFDEVNSFSTSYYLPLADSRGVTLYAGYSRSDVEDAAPQLDIRGRGYYFGANYSKVIKSTRNYSIDRTVGWFYQFAQNENTLGGSTFDKRELALSMPSLTIGYSEKVFDSLGGRNFFSNTLQANLAGKFGASTKEEYRFNTPTAEGDFVIDRFQFGRFQKLFSGENEPGKWTMFMRLSGQLADDSLVSALQTSVSPRGYDTDVSGDTGITGSIELRTPLISNFIPGLERTDEYLAANPEDWKTHRLQFIAFYDWARTDLATPVPGDEKNETFSSVGGGFRLTLTKYSQMSLDYGIPLDSNVESSDGKAVMSLQVQF